MIIPYAAGCQTIGIFPYREAKADRPRAVVGLTDLSARVYIRKQLGDNLLSFAMPFSLFREMEANYEPCLTTGRIMLKNWLSDFLTAEEDHRLKYVSAVHEKMTYAGP